MVKFFSFSVALCLFFNSFPVQAAQDDPSQQLVKFELAAKKIADAIIKDVKNNKATMVFFAPFHSMPGVPIARSTANLYFTKFEGSFLKYKPSYLRFKRSDNKYIKNDKQFKNSNYLITSELELRKRELTITFRAQNDGISISTHIVRIFDLPLKRS